MLHQRIVSDEKTIWDEEQSSSSSSSQVLKLRPLSFNDYPGQETAKENLRTYVEASKKRKGVLDHVLLHGSAGLGKTTLANIIAHELQVPF